MVFVFKRLRLKSPIKKHVLFSLATDAQYNFINMLIDIMFAALAGLSLTFALETLEAAQFGIYVASETENYMTSVERVLTYTEIDPEPGYSSETQPPEDWPTAGSMALHDLSLTYLEGAPAILNGVNVCIAAKEKVGVVGRTGAGKSSLVAALFRMPEPDGRVRIVFFLSSC